MKKYIALFETDEKGGYNVVFPDLAGLTSAGDTYEEAVRNAHDALAFYAEDVKKMPKPRTLEQIKSGWPDWNEWEHNYAFTIGFVDLLPSVAKTKRINITIDERLLNKIDKVSNNRSEFISNSVRKMFNIAA